MEKIKYILLTLLLVISLSACGQGSTTDTKKPNVSEQPKTEQEKSAEETELASKDPVENTVNVLSSIYLYFSDEQLTETYKVEEAGEYTIDEKGIQAAIERWIQGPKQEKLLGLVPRDAQVQFVEVRESIVYVSFSEHLAHANLGSTGELMLLEQLAMVVEQFGYKEIFVLIEGEVVESLLGHMSINEPLKAKLQDDYPTYTE